MKKTIFVAATIAASTAFTASALAESPRDSVATIQAGVGLINIVLPSLRLVGRYSQENASFELRAGVLVPSFAIGKVAWDGAATLRLHVLRRDKLTVFVGPRAGFFTITDKDEPYDYTPLVTVAGGADLHADRWVFTIDAGAGAATSATAFNDATVLPMVELNAYAGLSF